MSQADRFAEPRRSHSASSERTLLPRSARVDDMAHSGRLPALRNPGPWAIRVESTDVVYDEAALLSVAL